MVQQTQTIRRQQPTSCLSVFDHFVGLALKRLNQLLSYFKSQKFGNLTVHWRKDSIVPDHKKG